jgi:hypothetical protein
VVIVSLFHRHRWEEVARRFTPPAERGFEVDRITSGMLDRLVSLDTQGETVIELRCEECGDVTYRTLPGDAT